MSNCFQRACLKRIITLSYGSLLTVFTLLPPSIGQTQNLSNVVLYKDAFMVRLADYLPPASNANDGNLSTYMHSGNFRTVDAYWEVDLGETYAVYTITMTPADGLVSNMSHTTARLFDEEHNSVYSQKLDNFHASPFQIDLGGPRIARYVRIGLENKERISAPGAGSSDMTIGIKEVEIYGRNPLEVGLLDFSASTQTSTSGQSVTLSWHVEDVTELTLYPDPGLGSLMALTDGNGVGSITVSPTSSVEYRLVAEGSFGTHSQAQSIVVDHQPLPVRINEFLATNNLSLRDQYGESPDWIELYNPSNAIVDVTGYGLSDDPKVPTKWIFPETTMAPHSHLIVFASGREDPNHSEAGLGLHASWKLDADGEDILLTAPDGITLIDSVIDFGPQRVDLAYGRSMESNTWVFLEPTPLAINHAPSYQGWLAPPTVSQERGFYDRPFELSIQSNNPDATLMVSLYEGTPGTPGGRSSQSNAGVFPEPNLLMDSLYEDAPDTPVPNPYVFTMNQTTALRCTVVQQGYKSPPVETHTYLFIDDVIRSPRMSKSITGDSSYIYRLRKGLMDLPTFSVTVPELPDDYIERQASLEILWPDGSPAIQSGCGMVRYGGAYTTFPKNNYRLKFRQEYGARKLNAPLFTGFDHGFPAVEEFDTLDLRGGSHDMNLRGFYMAACFMEDSMLDMGTLNPHGRFVHLYINGDYWGQYYLREELKDTFLGDYLAGSKEDYFNVKGNDNYGSSFMPGTPDPIHRDVWTYIRSISGSYQDLKTYVDIPNLIDFMILWAYGNSETEYRAAGPVSPGDTSLGFKFWVADSDGFLRNTTSDRTGYGGPGDLFGNLVDEGDPEFLTLLADRIGMHLSPNGALGTDQNIERLATRMAEIEDSLIAECARWGNQTPSSWVDDADSIYRNLFVWRANQLLGYYRNRGLYPEIEPPTFRIQNIDQHGGYITASDQLTMTAPEGVIWYTLDGSDPRDTTVLPHGVLIVSKEAAKRVLVPTEPLPDDWFTNPDYDDSQWTPATEGVGYELGVGYEDYFTTDLFMDMFASQTSCYIRIPFGLTVADHEQITQLYLRMRYDDGFVAYLNGVELARANAPEDPRWNSSANDINPDASAVQWREFSVPVADGLLRIGNNVLAVQGLNDKTTSSDFLISTELYADVATGDQPTLPGRQIYQTAISLPFSATVKARANVDDQWSSLTEAVFAVGTLVESLRLTEIMYHPHADDPNTEFIEFENIGPEAINLNAVRFTSGINFSFTPFTLEPGQRGVIVEDRLAFVQRYGSGIAIAGQYTGKLSNGGERLTVVDALDATIQTVQYRDGWYPQTDGGGFSLVTTGSAEDLDQQSAWSPSPVSGGTPGL